MLEQGDVIIRNAVGGFVVADALSQQTLDGPFAGLTAALGAARRLAITGTIWREQVDERGRSMGHPRRIPEVRVLTFSLRDVDST
jgi:hypothetical protein